MANHSPSSVASGHHEELRLKNDLVELERLGVHVLAFGAHQDWPAGLAQELELALDEVVTNIISYAYDDDGAPHDISIRIAADADEVVVDVEDDGKPFDPTAAASAVTDGAIADRPVGGLGWHLVRSVTDGVAYRRDGARNILTIRKRIR